MTSSGFGIGRIRWNWLGALAVLLAALPLVYETSTPTLLAIWALFALSLALMWGYAGILSFGHAAYFGLGAYTYAIASFNIGESTVPLLLALAVPAIVAAIIGALMFYGRISDVYLGVMTLVVTLILNRFMNATAGDAYRIGNARLGGFNGIPAFPTLNVPGDPNWAIYGTAYYYVVIVCLLAAYLIARWILSSAFGRTLIGIRENEQRMELLGYDVAGYKTAIFSVSGAMAGLAGCAVRQLGRDRDAERVQPRADRRGADLGDRRRARHADRSDDRRGRARLVEARARASDHHRQFAGAGGDPDPGRAADPARLRAELRRLAAAASPRLRFTAARPAAPAGAALRCRTPSSERAGRRDPGSGRAVRRRARGRPRQFHAARTRTALPDRPERRGQEHVLQVDHRPDPRRQFQRPRASSAART